MNLISNALKFTPRGGYVKVIFRELTEGQQLCVSVRDSGVGMPIQIQKQLVADLTLKASVPGTSTFSHSGYNNSNGVGLGLHICQDIILRLGRNSGLQIYSAPGHGTEFMFMLYKHLMLNNLD
jgi:signal transduction histidine kinase